jgi:hypothetical protein
MSFRLAGSARVAIVAVSMLVGTAACGSDGPGAERSDPVINTASDIGTSDSATTVVVSELGVSEADVIELEQQLDEIDRVLVDLEEQLAQD